MANATAPEDVNTPRKFSGPGIDSQQLVVADCGVTVATAFAVSWKPLTNSKPKAINNAIPRRTKAPIASVGVLLASM